MKTYDDIVGLSENTRRIDMKNYGCDRDDIEDLFGPDVVNKGTELLIQL